MVTVPVTSNTRYRERPVTGNARQAPRASNFIGEALERTGQSFARAADDVDAIDAMYDEAGATRLVNDYQEYSRGRLHADDDAYLNSRGFDASNRREDTLGELASRRDELLEQAATPRMRGMLARQLQNLYGRDEQAVSTFSNAQQRQAQDSETEALVSNAQQDFVNFTALGDEAASRQAMMTGQMAIISMAERNGMGEEDLALALDAFESASHAAAVNDIVARGNPTRAAEYLEEHSGDILEDVETQLRASIGPAVDRAQAEREVPLIIESFIGSLPEEEVEEAAIASSMPVEGRITSGIGPRSRPTAGASTNHGGIDIAAPAGSPVRAVRGGAVVEFAGWNNGYGNHVILRYPDGSRERFGHMRDRPNVSNGQTIGAGATLGVVGSTGVSTGNHLHWNAWDARGNVIDPRTLVGATEGAGGNGGPQHNLALARRAVDEYIAANPGMSERLQQAYRDAADRRVSRNQQERANTESEAMRGVYEAIGNMGHRQLTDPSQINPALWNAIGPVNRASLLNRMRGNREALSDAQSESVLHALTIQSIMNPNSLQGFDLQQYADSMSVEDYRRAETTIARIERQNESTLSGVRSVIVRNAASIGINPNGSDAERNAAGAIANAMLDHLSGMTGGDRAPTQAEINAAFDASVIGARAITTIGGLWPSRNEQDEDILRSLRRSQRREELSEQYGY